MPVKPRHSTKKPSKEKLEKMKKKEEAKKK
jgi:hypothetical protein